MLDDKDIQKIKNELDNCKNPLFFFHDDPDGLCSFLLFYRYKGEGNGVVVKRSTPQVDDKFLHKIEEYNPDKIFILDLAVVDENFTTNVNVPVVWIDHHTPLKVRNVKRFNPKIKDKTDGTPVTAICYEVVKRDMWIAFVGTVGDWFFPSFYDKFKEKYPDLVGDETDPGKILFKSKIGKLIKVFSFILKGKTQDANKCYKILTRIEDPYEILDKRTAPGKYLMKKYEKINEEYDSLLRDASNKVSKEDLLVYTYAANHMSFTGDLANELFFRFPTKLIIVGREKSGQIKMSLRFKKPLLKILKKALEEVDGKGGGHEYACGASVKTEDFGKFTENLKKQIK